MAMEPTYTVWAKPGRKPLPQATYSNPNKAIEHAQEILGTGHWVRIELGMRGSVRADGTIKGEDAEENDKKAL